MEMKFYLTIKGERISVSEDVYRAYVNPIRAEQRKKRHEWKCKVVSKKGKFYSRCNLKCESCPYYLSGKNALGNKFSLDKLMDAGIDVEDKQMDLEGSYIEVEERKDKIKKLNTAISLLTPRQREMLRKIYFEDRANEEVAEFYGITNSAVSHAMDRIYASLKKILKNL
jgi:RNA polymerase sigma factor (sigma-70 family)